MASRRGLRLRAFAAKLRGFLRGPARDDEFDDEIQEHLRLLAERFVAQGMSRDEAAAAARRQFGNTTLLQEDRRALQTLPSIEAWWHDLRYALRTLWKKPGIRRRVDRHAGTGHRRGDRDLQRDPQRACWRPFPTGTRNAWCFRGSTTRSRGRRSGGRATRRPKCWSSSRTITSSTRRPPHSESGVLYRHRTGTEALNGAHVTPGTFEFFGMPALHGRVLQPGDYEPGAPPVFVMRHKTWMERFGGDPSILNTTLVLNGTPRTLVGIMPPRFGWYGADVYFPAKLTRGMRGEPVLVPGGTPEAGRLDPAGGSGADGDRPAPGEDEAASAGLPEGLPRSRRHAGRVGGRAHRADVVHGAGGRGPAAPDCLQQRGEPDAGPRDDAREGVRACGPRWARAARDSSGC